jgi:hypothetical protein
VLVRERDLLGAEFAAFCAEVLCAGVDEAEPKAKRWSGSGARLDVFVGQRGAIDAVGARSTGEAAGRACAPAGWRPSHSGRRAPPALLPELNRAMRHRHVEVWRVSPVIADDPASRMASRCPDFA